MTKLSPVFISIVVDILPDIFSSESAGVHSTSRTDSAGSVGEELGDFLATSRQNLDQISSKIGIMTAVIEKRAWNQSRP